MKKWYKIKPDAKKKKETNTYRNQALRKKRQHDKRMEGKKTKLVPHPTIKGAMIERIIE